MGLVRALLVLAVLGGGLARAAEPGGARLVLVGGAMEDDAIVAAMMAEAGPNARVGIITAASQVPEKRMTDLEPRFRRAGAASVIELAADADPAAVDGLDLVFMAGGSQVTLKDRLMPGGKAGPMMARLHARYAAGKLVVGGTSAGAAVTPSAAIISGGESLAAIRDGASPHDPTGGLLLFPHGLVDTHFSERGRQGRIVRLAADRGVRRAYGIDENTALVIRDALSADPRLRVVGKGGVSIFDLRAARQTRGTFDDVRMDYLTDGDRYRPATGRVTIGAGKVRAPKVTAHAADRVDALSSPSHRTKDGDGDEQTSRVGSRSMVRLARATVDRHARAVVGHAWEDPHVKVRLAPGRGAGAWTRPGATTDVATLRNVRLRFSRWR